MKDHHYPPPFESNEINSQNRPTLINSTNWDHYENANTNDNNANSGHSKLSGNSNMHNNYKAFMCLYTKHKTQKRKIWKDGKLSLQGTQVLLYDAYPPPGAANAPVDTTEVTKSQANGIQNSQETEMETEHFLITIEGPWKNERETSKSNVTIPKQRVVSSGMQKLMKSKFRKPSKYVPPHPEEKRRQKMEKEKMQRSGILGRKRPLQPGELERRYYGVAHGQLSHRDNNCYTQENHPPQRSYPLAHDQRSSTSRTISHPSSSDNGLGYGDKYESEGRDLNPQGHQNCTRDVSQNYSANGDQNNSNESQLQTKPLSGIEDKQYMSKSNQSKKSNTFTSNDFDPSSFYGEDNEEEDSDEEEEEETPLSLNEPYQRPQSNANFQHESEKNTNGENQKVQCDRECYSQKKDMNDQNNAAKIRKGNEKSSNKSSRNGSLPLHNPFSVFDARGGSAKDKDRNNTFKDANESSSTTAFSSSGKNENMIVSNRVNNNVLSNNDLLQIFGCDSVACNSLDATSPEGGGNCTSQSSEVLKHHGVNDSTTFLSENSKSCNKINNIIKSGTESNEANEGNHRSETNSFLDQLLQSEAETEKKFSEFSSWNGLENKDEVICTWNEKEAALSNTGLDDSDNESEVESESGDKNENRTEAVSSADLGTGNNFTTNSDSDSRPTCMEEVRSKSDVLSSTSPVYKNDEHTGEDCQQRKDITGPKAFTFDLPSETDSSSGDSDGDSDEDA